MNYLYFQDGDNDAYMYPVSSFLGAEHDGDTTMKLRFVSVVTGPGITTEIDTITLTIKSGAEKTAMKAIVSAVNQPAIQTGGFITVADNVNQDYITSDITDVAATQDS